MATQNLLYRSSVPINKSISICIPSVGQILEDEDGYYGKVSMLTAMPIDLIVQLDEAGIDFTSVNEYDLFLMMFPALRMQDTSLIFGDLDLKKFQLAANTQNKLIVLRDEENGITIDRVIHEQIASVLRKILHLEKNRKKPANSEAKDYMIKRAREKAKRAKSKKEDSYLESLIMAMVNTEQYKYDFEGTRELSIYQFNESVRQIVKKIDYDNKMHGVYAGTVSAKDLSQDDLNWLIHK